MILADTSGVFAALDRSQPHHTVIRSVLEPSQEPLLLSPFVLAELDYLLTTRVGQDHAVDLLRDVEAGAYELAPFTAHDVGEARELVERYRDLELGLADASIVVLSGRYATTTVLTLDERYFRVLCSPTGTPFTLLPADVSGEAVLHELGL